MTTIDTTGLDTADVLAALYNAARPQGIGFLHYKPEPMTRDEAKTWLGNGTTSYFDYLLGRVMKVRISNPLDPTLYDRDNGNGAAARAIDALRTGNTNLVKQHTAGVKDAARELKASLNTPSSMSTEGEFVVFTPGLDDVATPLNDAADTALDANARPESD